MQEITALDLAAYDAVGWNVNFDVLANSGYRRTTADVFAAATGVPEPTTWTMMILGFGMIGFGMRYSMRRSNAKFDFKIKRIAAGLEADGSFPG